MPVIEVALLLTIRVELLGGIEIELSDESEDAALQFCRQAPHRLDAAGCLNLRLNLQEDKSEGRQGILSGLDHSGSTLLAERYPAGRTRHHGPSTAAARPGPSSVAVGCRAPTPHRGRFQACENTSDCWWHHWMDQMLWAVA